MLFQKTNLSQYVDLTRKLMSALKKKKCYVITKGDIYKALNGGLYTVMSLIITTLKINFITTIMQMKKPRVSDLPGAPTG